MDENGHVVPPQFCLIGALKFPDNRIPNKLQGINIFTVFDLASISEEKLRLMYGINDASVQLIKDKLGPWYGKPVAE